MYSMSDIDDMTFDDGEAAKPPAKMATAKAIGYMRDLVSGKKWAPMIEGMPQQWRDLFAQITADMADKTNDQIADERKYVGTDISRFISELNKYEWKPKDAGPTWLQQKQNNHTGPLLAAHTKQHAPLKELVDGMYTVDDDIYKVYHTVHGANVQVAKKLVTYRDENGDLVGKFEYVGKAPLIKIQRQGKKLTLDEARDFGELYGTCCICGRPLTNELSIALGIGPVCGGRVFGGEFEFIMNEKKQELGL